MVQTSNEINNVVDFPFIKAPPEVQKVKADLDKGYTRIANTLLDQSFSFEFKLLPLRLFHYVIRQTYGYQRKRAFIANAQVGIDTRGQIRADKVTQVVNELVSMNVITIKNVSRSGRTVEINTTISEWKPAQKTPHVLNQQVAKSAPRIAKTARGLAKTAIQEAKTAKHIYKEESIKEEIKTLCPVSTERDAENDVIETQAKALIDHLNARSNSKFQHSTASLKHARARLREGIPLDDLKMIVDYKVWEWKDQPKMAQYIRPKTLFSENAESYINAANQIKQSGVSRNASANQNLNAAQRRAERIRQRQKDESGERDIAGVIVEQGEDSSAIRHDGSNVWESLD